MDFVLFKSAAEAQECSQCHIMFVPRHSAIWKLKNGLTKKLFCSRACRVLNYQRRITMPCKICKKPVTRLLSEHRKSKSGNIFCSPECGTIWSNYVGKKFNTRSILENQLEEFIKAEFPQLEVVFGDNSAIGAEIDIYFPQLKLGIEIHGAYHYYPVRGDWSKFIKTLRNDARKARMAKEAGIKLYVLNASQLRGNRALEAYRPQVNTLLNKLLEK
jgi:hypothetical protein